MVICGDVRTAAMFKIEAIDLADKGFHVPYYRREMVILHKVLSNSGIAQDKILDLFSKEENEGIYPAMGQVLVQALTEELESVGYLELNGGKVFVTKKGEAKLDEFKKSLSAEEREALRV
jgi:ribosomal protein S19E (S16A)